jgi:hypothetical protein
VQILQILLLFLGACEVVGLGIWWYLLSTICNSPIAPVAATGHNIRYNCDGTIVFISLLEDRLLTWLIPVMVVIGICGVNIQRRLKRK